jgi:uncharacterized protein (DUF983 family)
MRKGTRLYSILKNKCPQCHEGDFFKYSNAYNLKNMSKMPDNCSVCHQKYEPETGFYYGAMYVSYAIGVATFVTVWVATSVLAPEMEALGIIALMLIAIFIMAPLSYRLSRRVWINLFVKYKAFTNNNIKQTN